MRNRRKRKVTQEKKLSIPTVDISRQVNQLMPAEVRMICVCHSKRDSTDVSISKRCMAGKLPIIPAGRLGGFTNALLGLLSDNKEKKLTFQELLLNLRESLAKSGYDGTPQMTSSRELELQNTQFSLVGGTGCRRALLVGINYSGQRGELKTCINDVINMKKYIMEHEGYLENNIIVLVDDEDHPHSPTREMAIQALQRLVERSVSGDSVYFHYSGHGGLLQPQWNTFKKNLNANAYDETLCPVDHDKSGQIRDFSIFNHFVKPMAAGVTVTCVIDCCLSGSILDLPYIYKPTKAGKFHMQQSMNSLSNLAFLYVLAGGMLPAGFDDVINNIEDIVGGGIDHHYGLGIADIANDTSTVDHFPDYYTQAQEIEKSRTQSKDLDRKDMESEELGKQDEPDEGETVYTGAYTAYTGAYTTYTEAYTEANTAIRGSRYDDSSSSSSDEEDNTECGCVIDVFSTLFED